MLFLLPLVVHVSAASDYAVNGIRVDTAEFPVWVDFTRCVSDGMKVAPDADEQTRPVYDAVSEGCKKTVKDAISAKHYIGISSKPESRSHVRAVAIIDSTDQQMRTVFTNRLDPEQVNARVEKMGLGVTVYDPIAHLYEQYTLCLSKKYDETPHRHTPDERVAGWKKAIRSCKDLKASLKAKAEPIMAKLPDFQDPIQRKTAVDATFDGHDEMVIKAASIEWAKPD
jgi:hypothetical protein